MAEPYDELELRAPERREQELFAALPAQVAHAKARTAHYARVLAEVAPEEVTDRRALARLPVTRKSELVGLQRALLPFGGLTATEPGRLARIYVSPGPTYDPEGRAPDYWRIARALHAAGFRAGDIVQNCFSYHLTPGGLMLDSGLARLGCAVVPGGVGQTEMQVAAMAELRVTGYAGTPSFLKAILEKADELGRELPALRKAIVSGEAFFGAVRELVKARGIDAYQLYATADLGAVAYETPAREGMVVDEGVLVEIVRPGTGDPLPDGEVGEVVVTTFNADYPLIRYSPGDLSAVLPGPSPCGRTNMRIKGWMGRADQTTNIRGMFVHPHQIAEVVKRIPAIRRARVVVDNAEGTDEMRLLCVLESEASEAMLEQIKAAVREVTKLRAEVERVADLPNDGKVIDDRRKLT